MKNGWHILEIVVGVFLGFLASIGFLPDSLNELTVEQCTDLALLAAALSAITWFTNRSNTPDNVSENKTAKLVGLSFLLSAFCFTLVAGLAVFIRDAETYKDLFDVLVKWIAMILMILGTWSLSITACVGIGIAIRKILALCRK